MYGAGQNNGLFQGNGGYGGYPPNGGGYGCPPMQSYYQPGFPCPPRQSVAMVPPCPPPQVAAYAQGGAGPGYGYGNPWCPPWAQRRACSDGILNFNGKIVAPGECVVFTARVQQPFEPVILLIPSHIGQFFEVQDIRIGNDCIFQNAAAMSAVVFSEVSNLWGGGMCCPIQWNTIYPGIDVSIKVCNTDTGEDGCPAGSHRFYATIIGRELNC